MHSEIKKGIANIQSMELRQLKYFVKTASTLNFSEAARQLYITQSTLSQQIRQLEDELKCQLFERNAHTVKLTEYGIKLLPLALRCMQDADACVLEVANIKNLMIGTLNIGVTHSFNPILWYTMKEFLHTFKGVKLNVCYAGTDKLVTMLRRREIDFALAFKSDNQYEDIESFELFTDTLSVLTPSGHELVGRKKLTLSDIEPFPIALPSKEVQTRKWLDDALACNPEIHLNARIELNDANFILDLVAQSQRLITILPSGMVKYHSGLAAIPLDTPHPPLSGCIHTFRDNYRKQTAKEFIKMLCESPVVRIMK